MLKRAFRPINIKPFAIEDIYKGLNRIGALGDDPASGFLRAAYSDAESEAMQHIEQLAQSAGLRSRQDGVGNLIIETAGNCSQWIETGSHIDTVPGGGNFDGTAGVVAAVAALQTIQQSGIELKSGLRLRVWRGEESAAFGIVSIGSRAAFGQLPPASLNATHQGQTLASAMRAQGGDPELIRLGQPVITASECDAIAAYIEMHIEQGSVLESEGTAIGIVTGIRGSIRSWVKLRGAFDHSGATPMGRPYRRDANLAMAYMQVTLDQLAQAAVAAGQDIVQTIGVVNCSPDMDRTMPEIKDNAISKVSGCAYFSHEVRSASAAQAGAFVEKARAVLAEITAAHGVAIEIETFSNSPGITTLDSGLQTLAESSCRTLNLSYRHLPSGAWHDAAVVCHAKRSNGSAIPVGMLFIPCRGGISHSPAEYASPEQIAAGATVLANMMISLASQL